MHHKLNKQNNLRKRNKGFTLTEVVVASSLLLIAMVPILKALTSANNATSVIEQKTRSLTLAQAKLDDIKARSIYHYGDSFTASSESLDDSYLCNVTDSSVNSNLRTITVSVGYDTNGNNNLSSGEVQVSLITYVAKRW